MVRPLREIEPVQGYRGFVRLRARVPGRGESGRGEGLPQLALLPRAGEEGRGELLRVRTGLPDGYSQIFRLYVFGPSGLKDYGSAMLGFKI